MAPEMIQKKPYDFKIDLWALGILLFELIQGYAPFRGETGE
jgi:serine/threonine protein kinase